jgi:hypothetical protein
MRLSPSEQSLASQYRKACGIPPTVPDTEIVQVLTAYGAFSEPEIRAAIRDELEPFTVN